MKILYTTDLHGDREKYQMLVPIAKKAGVNTIINGGDILPTKEDLLSNQRKFITSFLDSHFSELQDAGIDFIGYLGNDDLGIFDDEFTRITEKYKGIYNLDRKKVLIGDYEFIGMNLVVDYPFRLKDRCRIDSPTSGIPRQNGDAYISRNGRWQRVSNWRKYVYNLPSIEDELKRLPQPTDWEKTIYLFHMPPCRIGLDHCFDGRKVGSNSIYNFISKYQPMLTLHGHIHESPKMSGAWKNNIGKTTCIQPGQGTHLDFALMDLSDLRIERIQKKIKRKKSYVSRI